MKKFKSAVCIGLSMLIASVSLSGCKLQGDESFISSNEIGVISREKGSGTRGAFIELFGIEEKNESGEKIDNTTERSINTNSTSVMLTTVAGDLYSIGYISLGSLNSTVKAVEVDGIAPSVEAIKNDSYKISRPFNIVTKGALSDTAQNFVDFILSADGQEIVKNNSYIPISDLPAYTKKAVSGKIRVEGSSSVTPVMEKLKEAYIQINPDVTIEIQQNDSSTGITSTIDGSCDIGMASRDLKDSETSKGVTSTVIAMDGIAIIVNNNSPVSNLTSQQIKDIYTGKITVWSDVIGE